MTVAIAPRPLPKGLLVMFEGLDGSGKTTQLTLARQELEAAGWPVLATRNLGGTPIGESLRTVMLSPADRPPMTDLFMSLAIQEALLEEIHAAREAGKIILLDRGPLSLAAYQLYGRGIGDSAWHYVEDGMSRFAPEAILLYETDIATALGRARHVGTADYFESKPDSYFEKVAAGYQAIKPHFSVTALDASQSIEDLHHQTMDCINTHLKQAI